jgi:hypothetical protein
MSPPQIRSRLWPPIPSSAPTRWETGRCGSLSITIPAQRVGRLTRRPLHFRQVEYRLLAKPKTSAICSRSVESRHRRAHRVERARSDFRLGIVRRHPGTRIGALYASLNKTPRLGFVLEVCYGIDSHYSGDRASFWRWWLLGSQARSLVTLRPKAISMNERLPAPCEPCHGSGLLKGSACNDCGGKGYRMFVNGNQMPLRQERPQPWQRPRPTQNPRHSR